MDTNHMNVPQDGRNEKEENMAPPPEHGVPPPEGPDDERWDDFVIEGIDPDPSVIEEIEAMEDAAEAEMEEFLEGPPEETQIIHTTDEDFTDEDLRELKAGGSLGEIMRRVIRRAEERQRRERGDGGSPAAGGAPAQNA